MVVILHGSYDHVGEGGCCLLDPSQGNTQGSSLGGALVAGQGDNQTNINDDDQ